MTSVQHDIPEALLSALLADYKKPEDLIGENGLLKQLTKAVVEKALQAELTEHLGHERHETRRSISTPMTACVPHAMGLRNTCSSTMHSDLIRHTAKPPQMRLTLQHCRLQKCKLHDRRDLA